MVIVKECCAKSLRKVDSYRTGYHFPRYGDCQPGDISQSALLLRNAHHHRHTRTAYGISIPNNNVRKQYYEFMLEEYQERRYIDLNSMLDLFYDMAYDGHWRESLEFIAHAYKENSSVRSAIEGERNIQGFFTAYLSVNAYYRLLPNWN